MNVEYLVVGLIAFSLLVYLVYVLLSPERLPASVQPAALRRIRAAPGLQHRRELRHEHELAGVCR
ncbi:MAG: potassium-transporting ATPase subunit F [Armatimonadetes bacterium]|nr:potassium-transporting ATPase subunit F [Armatimonadota bacterium]